MASTDTASRTAAGTSFQEAAKRHLWMHFTRMGSYADSEVPVIVRGDGPYVYDEHGTRYLDGLSALFCVNAGHGRSELGEAAARQVEELDFFVLWSYAHPRAIELAERIAALAPGDLNRVFFTSGGSEAVESAIKLVRAYHQRTGNPRKIKFLTREIAYHGTTLGALQATGIPALRTDFEPLVPGGIKAPNTNSYHWPDGSRPALGRRPDRGEDPLRGPGDGRRGDPRAAPERRRLHPAAGRLLPARARDLRPPQRAPRLRRGDLRLGPARPLLRLRALRLPAGHRDHGEGADLRLHADGGDDRLGAGLRAVRDRQAVVHARLHLRRPPGGRGGGDGQPRRLRARGPLRPRAPQAGRVPGDARRAPRHPDRRRRAGRRLLPRDRAGPATRRRRRASPTRNPSGCCAASSPASSTAAG